MENLCICERRDSWKDRTADSRPNMIGDLFVLERERERKVISNIDRSHTSIKNSSNLCPSNMLASKTYQHSHRMMGTASAIYHQLAETTMLWGKGIYTYM